jgi:hypothetical protein
MSVTVGRPGEVRRLLGSSRARAVRIARDSRVVRCGPSRSCSLAELIGVVEMLLGRDMEQLTRRRTPVGSRPAAPFLCRHADLSLHV